MDGFKRPPRPQGTAPQPVTPGQPAPASDTLPPVDLASMNDQSQSTQLSGVKRRKRWPFVALALLGSLIAAAGGAWVWYQAQLAPVSPSDTTAQRVEITEDSSFSYVANSLQKRGLIRNTFAFTVLASLEGKRDLIKAGTCNLTPRETAAEILQKITTGCHDFTSITFYPGATIETSLYAKTNAEKNGKEFKDPSIRASLEAAGYSATEINQALAATYDSPLFDGKPADAGYEGYIFGETYYVDIGASAQEVLQTAFDHMYTLVQKYDLEAKFKAQGLTLYQGITLASIVEKELDCEGKPTEERKEHCYSYQQRIAEVFYNRLHRDMSLGSDVTSIYASDKLGVASTIDVDSPYNTRKYAGLPPGPIATPGELALRAVANPTTGDDLYFLAGEDGLIYFATDEAGHNANIKNHCGQLCGDL